MKKLNPALLLLPLLLTACPGGTTPRAPEVSTIKSVGGTLVELAPSAPEPDLTQPSVSISLPTVPWSGGAGKMQGTLGRTTVDLGTVNANGTFTLNLPETVDTNLLTTMPDQLPSDCTGPVSLSDSSALVTTMPVNVIASKQGLALPTTSVLEANNVQKTGKMTIQLGALMYADREVTFSATLTCKDSKYASSTITGNYKLLKGWNLMTATAVTEHAVVSGVETVKSTVTMSSGSLPTDKWLFDGSYAAMTTSSPSEAIQQASRTGKINFLR